MAPTRPVTIRYDLSLTIAQAASTSPAIDLVDNRVVAVIIPHVVEATTAQLSFLASDSLAGTYLPVYKGGTKLTLPIAIDQFAVTSTANDLGFVRYLKIVAETAGGVAVVQAGQSVAVKLVTEVY